MQTITAESTHEAELIAVALAANEMIWIRKLLLELGFALGKAAVARAELDPKDPNSIATYLPELEPDDTVNEEADYKYALPPSTLANDNMGTTQTVINHCCVTNQCPLCFSIMSDVATTKQHLRGSLKHGRCRLPQTRYVHALHEPTCFECPFTFCKCQHLTFKQHKTHIALQHVPVQDGCAIQTQHGNVSVERMHGYF